MEYGGITRFPQDGNPKPRMFRANKENALVNRMGFNNPGALAVRENLIERRSIGLWPNNPVAANIGRSKKVSNDEAADDYSSTLDILWDYADLFVLNVSSPNTPGLRELQEVDHLRDVLTSCIEVRNRKGNKSHGRSCLPSISTSDGFPPAISDTRYGSASWCDEGIWYRCY